MLGPPVFCHVRNVFAVSARTRAPSGPSAAPGRRFLLSATLAAICVACGVGGREDLIGRYVVPATGEAWTLRDDGSCTIERGGTAIPCEWEFRRRDGETRLVVVATVQVGAARNVRRYVLTPGKWPGRPVTIPLSASATLRKTN